MKNLIALVLFFMLPLSFFAQELTAKKITETAVAKENPQEAAEYIKSQLDAVSVPAEKRALYAFLGSLLESMALYDEAKNSYAAAAGIAAGDAAGMPKKSSEMLVIDAVRCALSAGDGDVALQFLNSAVRNSKDESIQAQIKLYEQWAALCNAENADDIAEPVSMLKAYADIPSMKSVNPSVLLTLWYVTGEADFGNRLVKKYPESAEAGIVTGKVQVMPSPFWYFVPRRKIALTQPSAEEKTVSATENGDGTQGEAAVKADFSENPVKQQLGLFRDKSNAEEFVRRLNEKNFKGYIQEETRSSGTTYYIVLVDENEDGSMGLKLKSAGFECYPVFH
ncbi:MAG: SPOR domain-containing protein [Treponema porcinum]|uniref:SPOR domain-containing protein n=1 Tax=Treponema porcinum TaxID=261392 RepID=UPI002A7EB219|nr:SPOR domain-containing protein [Treponema porcinum]MDY5047114.1 SPOR domain-containing protein [Treponema porcinum]